MKKIVFVIAFILSGVVLTNAQTQNKDKAATPPVQKAQVGDVPAAAPATPAVVTPENANVEVNKDATVPTDKACSKQKESCNKGEKSCCKNKKTADASKEKACCKKDNGGSCHKKAEASAEAAPTTPAEAAPATPAPANK